MAEFNLQSYISTAKDFSRGYVFYASVSGGGFASNNEDKYFVRSSSLPASAIEQATTNWQGNAYKLGTTNTYADFTITYNVDINDNLRERYEEWNRSIHDVQTNNHGMLNGLNVGYLGEVFLEHLSHRDGSIIMTYKLVGAWPSSIGELALDYATKDVAQFTVTFTYQYHLVSGVHTNV